MATEAPPASSATVREVRIVDAGPPKPPPAPTGRELRPADIAALPGDTRQTPDSSRTSLTKNLERRAKPSGDQTVTPTPVKEPPKPAAEKPAATEGDPAPPKPGEAPAETPPGQQPAPAAGGEKKKANPWTLFNEEKKARASAESEVQRLKTSIVPEQERTALMERVTKAESRAQELENHIRFVDFSKSKEFAEQFQTPYETAWKRATTELSEISVTDPISNQPRAVTSEDILELVNLPLGKAREVADQVFGKFADDVMAHRKEIRGLFDKQNAALEEARKNGGARDQQRQEQAQKQHSEVSTFVQTSWKSANDEFLNDPVNGPYFKPKVVKEGEQPTPEEQEWNDALGRGMKFVDEAWSANAMAPNLTPEQRAAVVKKNAAVRLRAAAFGPLKRLTKRLEAKVAQLEKDLEQYAESTPGAGGSRPETRVETGERGMAGFRKRLEKIAH